MTYFFQTIIKALARYFNYLQHRHNKQKYNFCSLNILYKFCWQTTNHIFLNPSPSSLSLSSWLILHTFPKNSIALNCVCTACQEQKDTIVILPYSYQYHQHQQTNINDKNKRMMHIRLGKQRLSPRIYSIRQIFLFPVFDLLFDYWLYYYCVQRQKIGVFDLDWMIDWPSSYFRYFYTFVSHFIVYNVDQVILVFHHIEYLGKTTIWIIENERKCKKHEWVWG